MANRILIKDATLVTMDENRDQDRGIVNTGDLYIENDLIKQITCGMEVTPEDVQIISGKNKVVIPGLINLHNHAAMTLFRSYADDYPLMEWLTKKIFPAEAKLTEDDVYWGTSLALLEMIRGGTTTFVDMYYYMEQTARACQEAGIRALLSQVFINSGNNKGLNSLEDAIDFIENWQDENNGRIQAILGPHALYTCPPDFLKKMLKKTEHLNAIIHIHLSESRGEVEETLKNYQKTPVALLEEIGLFERDVIAGHCVHLNDQDIAILSSRGVGISHNPCSNLKLANGIAPLKKLLDHGACVGLGTDGAASNNNLDMFEEIKLCSLLQKGLLEDPTAIPALEAFKLATRGGVKAIKKENSLGILKEGAKADLAIVDFNKPHLQPHNDPVANLVYAASAGDVETVIIDGNILYHKGEFLTMDQERIYYEAAKCSKRLRQ